MANRTVLYMYFKFFTICWGVLIVLLLGRRQVQAGDDGPEEIYLGLPCRKVERVGGFKLNRDDPANYTDKITSLVLCKDLEEGYPPGADRDTSAKGEGAAPEGMLGMLSKMHYELSKLAANAEVKDLCSYEKANRLENVISGLTSKDLSCKFCKKTYSSVTRLRNHLKSKHLKKTAHHCATCNKYFGDATTLLNHSKKHDPSAAKFTCGTCQKVCYSQAKLQDHMVVHSTAKPFMCQFCKEKSFKRVRTLKDHEGGCEKNPDRRIRKQCRLCPKNYADQRSLRRHFRESHPGEDPDL